MPVVLDHTIVPASDRHASAAFLAALLGLAVDPPAGPFAPLVINTDTTLDFDDRVPPATPGHWAFRVDDATFDAALARLAALADVAFGRGPGFGWDRTFDSSDGMRRVYVRDPDGHVYELFTGAA